jgi:hypothetical protein
MPDTPVVGREGGPYPSDMEARVTILEHIAQRNAATFERLDRRFEASDRRFEAFEHRLDQFILEHRAEFRWLLGIMLAGFGTMLAAFGGLLGAMAHGFHWL